jgi:hypothetical protein
MGILVQRKFLGVVDDRDKFEPQSREDVWINMRHNGTRMIAYVTRVCGAPGDTDSGHLALAYLRGGAVHDLWT